MEDQNVKTIMESSAKALGHVPQSNKDLIHQAIRQVNDLRSRVFVLRYSLETASQITDQLNVTLMQLLDSTGKDDI